MSKLVSYKKAVEKAKKLANITLDISECEKMSLLNWVILHARFIDVLNKSWGKNYKCSFKFVEACYKEDKNKNNSLNDLLKYTYLEVERFVNL